MRYIKELFYNTYEEKKSKFIAYLMPYDDFDKAMQNLRVEHPKARHFVYAYRYLNDYEQIVENCSDDGEPKGTSGKPSLAVIAGNELINTAVIIVRYFGGVKLGTGGLVRAYSDSVNEVIKNSELFEYQKLISKTLTCDYNELSLVEYLLNQENVIVKSKEFLTNVIINIQISQEQWESLESKLSRNIVVL